MAKDDILVVNATQMQTRSAGKSGKARTTTYATTVTSEPISINLDEKHVAIGVAMAIADSARKQTRAITATVKDSTADARKVQERAFGRGKGWARQRFSGGKMGITPPVDGALRQFNHSGRLAMGLVATYREKQNDFAINYPANRWNLKHWKSAAHMEAQFNRWISYCPALSNPKEDMAVQRAARDTLKDLAQKHPMGTTEKAAKSQAVARAAKESMALEKLLVQSIRAAAGALGA